MIFELISKKYLASEEDIRHVSGTMKHTTNAKMEGKFTTAQLATLQAEYATTPERLSDESIEKLRSFVARFSDEALAQVICKVRVKWITTLALTEARMRGKSRQDLEALTA